MRNKINIFIYSIFSILVIVFLTIYIYDSKNTLKEYSSNFYYMDTYIYVKVYSKSSNKANKALEKVESIYKNYHEEADRYNNYDGINNIYYIKNNDSNEKYIEISDELYKLIQFGLLWKDSSEGLIDINFGNVLDIWKKYRENGTGIPSEIELNEANVENEIILKSPNLILNNHPNIDLGSIAKGYATEAAGDYLKSIGLNTYLINAGGNVLVGEHYDSDKYKIGLEDPNDPENIFIKIKANNKAIVTSGGYNRYFEYNGTKYNHIINPFTLYPADNVLSVSVICNSSSVADILSTYLFLLDIDKGMKYIESVEDVEAVWYTKDNKIIYSSGFKEYLYE